MGNNNNYLSRAMQKLIQVMDWGLMPKDFKTESEEYRMKRCKY
jgi:hypothetical protein